MGILPVRFLLPYIIANYTFIFMRKKWTFLERLYEIRGCLERTKRAGLGFALANINYTGIS